jgi:hypothetical protein
MGSAQVLDGGDVLVGWGTEPYITEFSRGGEVILDLKLPLGGENYRTFRLPWTGRPTTKPKLVVRSTSVGRRLYVSWNGATEVATWQLHSGARAGALEPGPKGPRLSFETTISAPRGDRFAAVTALDAHGTALATSNVVRV